jgi:surface antigen
MSPGVSPLRYLIAASAVLSLLSSCGGGGGDGAGSSQAIYTATDLQKMKFIMGFRNARGETCRMVEQTVVIGGQKTSATRTMCEQPDGRWALQY